MWIANNWKDYEVLDTSNGEKLERWGEYNLVRPDPQVIWNPPHDHNGWKKKNGLEDLEKARWYLNRLIDHVQKQLKEEK